MRVFVVAAMMMLLWAGAAVAQQQGDEKTPAQIEAEKAAEHAYKQSLGNIPDQGPVDPWGEMRPNAPKQSTAKATKTKSGTTTN